MSYTFSIKRNVFMYNHVLVISDGQNHWEAIIESHPKQERTMLIWLEDFAFPKSETDTIKAEMLKWFSKQNESCIFYPGKGR